MERSHRDQDYLLRVSPHITRCVSPRLVLLDRFGKTVMVANRRWFGFPGGTMQSAEYRDGMNYMAVSSYPTLAREFSEETGVDPESARALTRQGALLTVTVVAGVDNDAHQIRAVYSPYQLTFVEDVEDMEFSPDITLVNVHRPPKKVFPDAQLALQLVRFRLEHGRAAEFQDECVRLATQRASFFQTHPFMKPLPSRPKWLPPQEGMLI